MRQDNNNNNKYFVEKRQCRYLFCNSDSSKWCVLTFAQKRKIEEPEGGGQLPNNCIVDRLIGGFLACGRVLPLWKE